MFSFILQMSNNFDLPRATLKWGTKPDGGIVFDTKDWMQNVLSDPLFPGIRKATYTSLVGNRTISVPQWQLLRGDSIASKRLLLSMWAGVTVLWWSCSVLLPPRSHRPSCALGCNLCKVAEAEFLAEKPAASLQWAAGRWKGFPCLLSLTLHMHSDFMSLFSLRWEVIQQGFGYLALLSRGVTIRWIYSNTVSHSCKSMQTLPFIFHLTADSASSHLSSISFLIFWARKEFTAMSN